MKHVKTPNRLSTTFRGSAPRPRLFLVRVFLLHLTAVRSPCCSLIRVVAALLLFFFSLSLFLLRCWQSLERGVPLPLPQGGPPVR